MADERVLESLQRVTDAALAHLSQEDLLIELLQRTSEIFHSDTAAILMLESEGKVLRPRAAKGIEEEVEAGITIPVGRGFAGRIAAERRPIAIEDIDHADIVNPILRQKGIRSLLGVPLFVEGRVIGVMHVGSLTHRIFTADEEDLLQRVADRAALAIDHAQLIERERRARRHLEAVQRVTDVALAYLPQDDLLNEVLERISEILHSDTAAILMLEPGGEMVRARAAKGIEEEVEAGTTIPVGRGFAGRIAAERRPIAIENVDHADILNPILRQKGIRSLLGVPLLVEGRVIGVLHVGSLKHRIFTSDEHDLLQRAADRAAVAIEAAQLYEQRQLAEALQRRLLPEAVPTIAGLEVATRYLPASGESLGGDWYDAFELGRGRIVVAVGDVVGHGLSAAAVMAQLRTALRAYAIEDHAAAEVVERVNGLMWDLGPSGMTTLAFLIIDPTEESVEFVNAGHPPPLIVEPDGTTSFLPMQGGIALGASPTARYRSDTLPFRPGTKAVLYTDGLVERRRQPIDEGLEQLRSVAAGAHRVEELAEAIVSAMVAGDRPDDVALIVACLPELPDDLETEVRATREALVGVRRLLRRWLRERGATEDETYDITVACQEACANAVEHAYRPGRGTVRVEATYHDGRVRVTVRDHGRWRAPRGTNRGRGLPLARALMEEVDVQKSSDGTTVVLERTLGRAAE